MLQRLIKHFYALLQTTTLCKEDSEVLRERFIGRLPIYSRTQQLLGEAVFASEGSKKSLQVVEPGQQYEIWLR